MKKMTSLFLVIIFTLLLSACTYEGNYSYIEINAQEFGIPTGYSIAFPKGSPHTGHFNEVVNKMLQDGKLDCFNQYWLGDKTATCYASIDFTNKVYTDITHSGNGATLKTMTSTGYEPFEVLDENGKPAGFDIDLVKFIAKELNYKVDIVDAEFDSIIASLTNKKADLAIAAITPTDDRKESVDFTVEYFTESYTVAIFRESDNFKSVDDMKSKTVAAQSGTVQADLIDHIYSEDRVRKAITVNYPAAAMQSLKTNKIDVFFVEKSVADELLKEYNKK